MRIHANFLGLFIGEKRGRNDSKLFKQAFKPVVLFPNNNRIPTKQEVAGEKDARAIQSFVTLWLFLHYDGMERNILAYPHHQQKVHFPRWEIFRPVTWSEHPDTIIITIITSLNVYSYVYPLSGSVCLFARTKSYTHVRANTKTLTSPYVEALCAWRLHFEPVQPLDKSHSLTHRWSQYANSNTFHHQQKSPLLIFTFTQELLLLKNIPWQLPFFDIKYTRKWLFSSSIIFNVFCTHRIQITYFTTRSVSLLIDTGDTKWLFENIHIPVLRLS